MKATSLSLGILAGLLASQALCSQTEDSISTQDFVCSHPPYQVHLISSSPLVIYIKNFLTPTERAHLVAASQSKFRRSIVSSGSSTSGRTSQSAYIPRDPVVECIEERVLNFQGLSVASSTHLEPIQLVKYASDEHYHLHNDWFPASQVSSAATGGNRKSSFFAYVYVRNDTTGGGTNFPYLSAFDEGSAVDEKWCDILDCDEPSEKGVTFRPVEGNAVYWENLVPGDGGRRKGDHRTLHAGSPVTGGEKVGLNIWTREGPLSPEVRESIEYPS
ncbi:prolyl 4-hydroxylase 1 [Cladorrhinum sp. PSN259]|nr:prolyl 4-hydroxylase 1 [Cladorrhinum sp. PSN259]